MIVANSPVQWPSWTWCRKWWNHLCHSSRVTLNQRCFAFIRPRTPLVYRYHVISRTQSHSAVFGCSPFGMNTWSSTPGTARRHVIDSWATESVLVGLNMYRAGNDNNNGRIRLSESAENRTYQLSKITHVTPFRKYVIHSTGPRIYGRWDRTYSMLFSCKSILTVCSYRAQSNEICMYGIVSRGSLPRVRRYSLLYLRTVEYDQWYDDDNNTDNNNKNNNNDDKSNNNDNDYNHDNKDTQQW